MSEKDINTLFDEAFANAQLIPQESVPQDMQLVLYGLYKQATSETSNPLLFQNPQDLRNSLVKKEVVIKVNSIIPSFFKPWVISFDEFGSSFWSFCFR